MAAADYAEGNLPDPPPLVRAAVRYGKNSRDDLDLPAGLDYKLSRLYFAYQATKSYLRAARMNNTVKWSQSNPDHWKTVSWIMKRKRNG